MSDNIALAFMSVVEQGQLIRDRKLSPVELVELYLRRIEAWDGKLRSFITVCADQALDQAREAEREIMAGRYRGPLHGIPYGVKDQIHAKGIVTTMASRVPDQEVATEDATCIARLAEAGAILIGKQNLHELGKGGTNVFPYGLPRNPWNLEHTASSSSSGSGIAPAAGLCSASLGEDTGGSVRGPASANGIVGIRPTFGRVSRHGGVMYAYTSDTIGPMARTVADVALVLGAIAGHDPKDPLSSARPVPDYTKALDGDIRGLKLAVVREMTYTPATKPDVLSAFEASVEVLRSLGATVEEVSLPFAKYAVPLQMLTADVDVAAVFLHKWLRTRWDRFDTGTRSRIATACLLPGAVYSRAMRARAVVRRQILETMGRYDALLSPTNLTPAGKIEDVVEKIEEKGDVASRLILRRICHYPISLANATAIAVPNGFSQAGLPTSLQIACRPFAEDTMFRIAHAFERATAWHTRHPDLARTAA